MTQQTYWASNLKQEQTGDRGTPEGRVVKRGAAVNVGLVDPLTFHGLQEEADNLNGVNRWAVMVVAVFDEGIVKRIPKI